MPLPTCTFIPSLGMFRVDKRVGKTLTSGGYGVSLKTKTARDGEGRAASEQEDKEESNIVDEQQQERNESSVQSSLSSMDHLYIEEALFLQQQGLLKVMKDDECDDTAPYSTAELFQIMLDSLHVSLPTYLSYAHLRSQDYRVLRHNEERLVWKDNTSSSSSCRDDKRTRRTIIRTDDDATPQPRPSSSSMLLLQRPSWDVYHPNTHFRKTNPGVPDFCVVVTTYNSSSSGGGNVTFDQLQELLAYIKDDSSRSTTTSNLQIAAVADSGTVVMFGVTDHGVQDISAK
jgi:hypothetical protein